jgi:manganese/iron transport system substrate-binding protein
MKNLESISRETGVKIGGQLFGDSLGPQGSGAETTLGMWKKNMATIIKAIK